MPAKTMLPKKEAKLIEVINGMDVANELRLFAVGEEEGKGEDVGEGDGEGEGNEVPHATKWLMTRV